MSDHLSDIMKAPFIILGAVSVFVLIPPGIVKACSSSPPCVVKRISAVGACDKGGWCGVSYADETFGEALRPIVGKKVCASKE